MGNVLSVRQLSKHFILHILGGKVIAGCEEIGFDLKQGEFLGLTGPSGAGKSTVLKCIYRTYLPTSGQMLYTGKDGRQIDLACAPEREMIRLRRREIGYVSQFLKVMPRVPAVDVLAGELRQKGWEMERARQRAREFLKIMDINQALWDAYPSTFSGGEQQRINLARTLITEPRLLLLDEPQGLESCRGHDDWCFPRSGCHGASGRPGVRYRGWPFQHSMQSATSRN
jgi:alpha-D-ribose 1-methylphosphonate 5-triphosphate synthase subunit PhnL